MFVCLLGMLISYIPMNECGTGRQQDSPQVHYVQPAFVKLLNRFRRRNALPFPLWRLHSMYSSNDCHIL